MIPPGFSSAVSSLPLWSVALEGSSKEISKGLFICWGLHRTVLNRQWVRAAKWHFALESLMVMNKNKRRIQQPPQAESEVTSEGPGCTTAPSAGGFGTPWRAPLAPSFWRMLRPLSSAVFLSSRVPAQNFSCTHCWLHSVQWHVSGILRPEGNHLLLFFRSLPLWMFEGWRTVSFSFESLCLGSQPPYEAHGASWVA